MNVLHKWLSRWVEGKMKPFAQKLWGRVLLIPSQEGIRPRSSQEGGEAPIPSVGVTPKLRSIGLAESLLKIGEGALLEPLISEVRRHLEPNQLGMGMPDGVVMVVLLLRYWVEAAEQSPAPLEDESDPKATIPLNLRNAYGLFLRYQTLKAAPIMHLHRF